MGKVQEYRRIFHRYPETGWLTYFATLFLAEHLKQAGYDVLVGREIFREEARMDPPTKEEETAAQTEAVKYAKSCGMTKEQIQYWYARMDEETGVLAKLSGEKSGNVRAFRFDMDALAVTESTDGERIPNREGFCSERLGISHACGHDGHMAIGLAFAEEVSKYRKKLEGTVLFIFQPAEEGVRGAVAFCNQWRFGSIDELYCCHIGFAPEDTFVAGAGGFLATTKFDAAFFGKSAHAGLAPERGKNALLAAAESMIQMQKFPRSQNGITRLNVGQLRGGEARNTIPAYAWMQVETRGETGELNQYMETQALQCIRDAAEQYGVTAKITFRGKSVSAKSDKALAKQVLACARRLGEFEHYQLDHDFGASDDGAVFMDMVQRQGGQAVYLLFGAKIRGLHHEAEFDYPEEVLEKAVHIFLSITGSHS